MSLIGILPFDGKSIKFKDNISSGEVVQLRAFGFRNSISAAVTGDDIWTGTATTLPIPPDAGEQMQVVSTSANDTLAGTGAQVVMVHYIDHNGNEQSEMVNMNGVTPVLTVAADIRFVQRIHTVQAGNTFLAAGTITISKAGTPAQIYTQVLSGTNESLNTSRMVPAGKTLLIDSFNASGGAAAGGKSADIRLRITATHGILHPRLFHFKDNFLAFNSATARRYDENPITAPSLSIVKCTAYATAGGADVQASWTGKMIDNPQ